MDGLSPDERTFLALKAAQRPSWSLSAVLSSSPLRDLVRWGHQGWKQGRLNGSSGTTKPHSHSFFIELPSIYPWNLVAGHNQTCAGGQTKSRVPSSLGKMRLGVA